MKAIVLLCLLALLGGCERYPSKLPPEEQVQALIYMDLAADLYKATSSTNKAYPLFLCSGTPARDASPAVLAFVSKSFRSARLCSAADPRKGGPILEHATGREGCDLWIAPFTLIGDGPLTIPVETHSRSSLGVGYEYQIQRIEGRWKVLKREQLWIN